MLAPKEYLSACGKVVIRIGIEHESDEIEWWLRVSLCVLLLMSLIWRPFAAQRTPLANTGYHSLECPI